MNLESTLEGRKLLVTGAGSGIGKAAAVLLAKCGAQVALLGRTREELTETFDDIGGEAKHLILTADVSNENDMERAASILREQWGALDGVVANAGINGVWAPLDEIAVAEWNQTLSVNLGGTFLTLRNTIDLLKRQGGSVVIIASINGTRIFSNSGAAAYASSKAGQLALTKMSALELAKDRIRVNVICPGAIETNIESSTRKRNTEGLHLPVEFPDGDVPLTGGRPGSAEDVAMLIWFLISEASSHISGTEIYIDGAQSLLQG